MKEKESELQKKKIRKQRNKLAVIIRPKARGPNPLSIRKPKIIYQTHNERF